MAGRKFRALVWKAGVSDSDGDIVSRDVLRRCARNFEPVDVLIAFDPGLVVGKATACTVLDDWLIAKGTLDDLGRKAVEVGMVPVPGYISSIETGSIMRLFAIGLTSNPAVPGTSIEILGD